MKQLICVNKLNLMMFLHLVIVQIMILILHINKHKINHVVEVDNIINLMIKNVKILTLQIV